MANLALFRRYILLFSCGLVFVVSQVVGDGRKPGLVDGAATSIAKRLKSAPASSNGGDEPYEVALTQTDAKPSSPWFAKDEPPADTSQASSTEGSSDDALALPPPGEIEIHK